MSIHQSVRIHPSARIDCRSLTIGAGGVVGRDCVIEGTRVEIGRELWMDEGARIGGGSCHDPQAFLKAGDWLHLGKHSELNIARGITIGDEVGIGIESKLFTHGAYLDELAGFPCEFAPITIGSRVWLPNAWVNPGVSIGNDIVVAARSLINRNLLDGSFAAGTPIKIVRTGQYPRALSPDERRVIVNRIAEECCMLGVDVRVDDECTLTIDSSVFGLHTRTISGTVTAASEIVRNQLRRHGIRFRYSPIDGKYEPWP